MARLTWKGASIGSLYELDTNLEQVVSDLGLAKMSAEERKEIRGKLGEVIGRGYAEIELSPKLNPDNKLQIKNITATLEATARHLQEAAQNLRGSETGFQQAHQLAISLKIREMLVANPEIESKADEFLSNFCGQLSTVAHACFVAAKELKSTKGNAGRRALDWYNDFARVLVPIAKQNGIRPTVTIHRGTGEAQGRFLDIATGFERLLMPSMRSPSKTARAKRLSRALAGVSKGPRAKSSKNRKGQNRHHGG